MSIAARLSKLEKALKPRLTFRYVTRESDITNEPNVIWVLINL